MEDKFFLNKTLKNRLGKLEVQKINKNEISNNKLHLSSSKINTLMSLTQNAKEPIFYAIQKALPSACLIVIYYNDGAGNTQNWSGSGFLIEENVIVTSNHVLPNLHGEYLIKVSFDGNKKYLANILKMDDNLDVGFISLKEKVDIPPIPPNSVEPIPGDKIAVIGAPEGWNNIVTVGYVSGVNQTPQVIPQPSWSEMIFIDADIYEGSSGSMVINEQAEAIGIVMGIIGKHAEERHIGQNAVVPIKKVLQSLNQ